MGDLEDVWEGLIERSHKMDLGSHLWKQDTITVVTLLVMILSVEGNQSSFNQTQVCEKKQFSQFT